MSTQQSSGTSHTRGDVTFSNDVAEHRYELHRGDTLIGVLDYAVNAGGTSLVRSFTQPPYRGRGYAADLVDYAVSDIEQNGTLPVIPLCWYVSEWFDKNPDRATALKS